MKIVNKTVISLIACGYILTATGCLDDRTNFTDGLSGLGLNSLVPTPEDNDGDGLSNEEEARLGTKPDNPDTDGDGLNDGAEVNTTKTDPKNPDTDGDGLNDGDEVFKHLTDPLKKDTDGDGLNDGDEVNKYKTDPLKPDTDGDGLNDGLEVKLGIKPTFVDTDKDGVTDGIEVVGTYPENIADDGKVTTAGHDKIEIVEIKIDSITVKVIKPEHPLSIDDMRDIAPANINTNKFNDPDNKIDALDPNNDSDYDKRPNMTETQKKTDPLNQKNFYPWIYETPQGIKMEEAGFIYIPAIDGNGGFWMSQYQARAAGNRVTVSSDNFSNFINTHFTVLNDEVASGFNSFDPSGTPLYSVVFKKYENNDTQYMGVYGFEAASILDNSQVKDGWSTSLPSDKEYEHAYKLMDKSGADSVKNGELYLDPQVEEDYSRSVYELLDSSHEFTNTLVKLDGFVKPSYWSASPLMPASDELAKDGSTIRGKIGSNDPYALSIRRDTQMDLRFGIAWGDSTRIGFRAASDYIK